MDQFKELEATELFCSKCKMSVPVKKRLLLVLPDGDKYEYTCSRCGSPVGGKMDFKPGNLSGLLNISK